MIPGGSIDRGSLSDLTGLQQAELLAAGTVTSAELVEACIVAADREDQALGLFITRLDDQAREWAASADEARAAGDPRPLLGVPFAVKDLHPMAGVPCTLGSAAIEPLMAPADGQAVGLLRAAGLIPIGTTNACEFGPACYTRTTMAGDARNPWDPTKSASGSSGGSAAAVAARVVPWAHASDGAGSIRLPASVCGLVGLKPSRGVTPAQGPSFLDLGVEGALTRTVADSAALFDVLAGGVGPTRLYPLRPVEYDARPLRIAVCIDAGATVAVDEESAAAVADTAETLRGLGHTTVEISDLLGEIDRTIATSAVLDLFAAGLTLNVDMAVPADRRDDLQPYTRYLAARGATLTGSQILATQAMLAAVSMRALAKQSEYDLVLTPTASRPQVSVDEFWLDQGDETFAAMVQWAAFAPIANCTGQPAISLPFSQTREGLPLGVQLLGMPGQDRTLLAVAADLERVRPWADRRPSRDVVASAVTAGS